MIITHVYNIYYFGIINHPNTLKNSKDMFINLSTLNGNGILYSIYEYFSNIIKFNSNVRLDNFINLPVQKFNTYKTDFKL